MAGEYLGGGQAANRARLAAAGDCVMGSRGMAERQQRSTFFTAEQEGFTNLRFLASEELPGTGLQETEPLWDFFDAFGAGGNTGFVNRFLELGIPAGAALPWLLARNVGCARAVDILLEGERLTAKQGHKLRLVSRLARPDALERKALAVAARFASEPSDSSIAIKKAMRSAVCDLPPCLDQEGMGIEHLPRAQPEE